jgi:hypothetical protein
MNKISRYMVEFEPALVSATSDDDAERIIVQLLADGKIPRIADVGLVGDDSFGYYGEVSWSTWEKQDVEDFLNELNIEEL